MKTKLALLTALLGFAAGSAFAAEKWDKTQQELAEVVQAFAKANVTGNLDQMMDCTDPAFTAWDFSKPAPVDRATYRKNETEFYKNWSVLDCALIPTLIRVEKYTAVAHGRHMIRVHSMKGDKRAMEGSWTAAFVNRDNRWLFINLSWIDDRPVSNEAAIKQDVITAFRGLLAAEERLDAGAVWAYHADVPGYWWADADGKFYDFAGTKKSWAEYYIPLAKLKFTTKQQEVMVLGPDTAYYLWHGAAAATMKDGATTHVDPWTARYLFRRIGSAWKIVGGQESSLPPQPAPAPTANTTNQLVLEAAIRDADAAWAKAVEAKSIDQTLAFYDVEAVTAGSAMFPARGLPAFRENWAKLFARPDFALTWKSVKVAVSESATVAYSTGTWSMSGPNENGPYLAVWRKQEDSQWKVLIDAAWRAEPMTAAPDKAAMEAPKPPRRVVTGVNAAGKSVVVSDGPVPPEGGSASKGGNGADLWLLDHVPADLADSHDPIAGYKKRQWPPAGGVIARVATWPPGFAVQKHQSATIDFVFIISGSLELLLEESSVTLGPGDSVVQRGTNHGWRVVGDQPCTLGAVLLAATK